MKRETNNRLKNEPSPPRSHSKNYSKPKPATQVDGAGRMEKSLRASFVPSL